MLKQMAIGLELGKVRITFAVSITTLAGYLLHGSGISWDLAWTVLGIFLLASGASALNHLQEKQYDRKMRRTRQRPLPSGRIGIGGAVAVMTGFTLGGAVLLFFGAGWPGLALGFLAYFWYNVVYTYLKRLTAWAVVPGSLIGSIPPVIGWISAGGTLSDHRVWPIIAFFFIWQVPHFWLLIMKYGKEYEAAGFPSLSRSMNEAQIGRMVFGWIIATALVTILFTLAGPLNSLLSKAGLWLASAWLIFTFLPILRNSLEGFRPGKYFMRINYFVLFVVLFMCLDKIF